MLQLVFISVAHTWFPGFRNLTVWNFNGLICAFLLHTTVVEFLYYWMHRAFHRTEFLFRNYHYVHHLSTIPEPATGNWSLPIHVHQFISYNLIRKLKFGLLFPRFCDDNAGADAAIRVAAGTPSGRCSSEERLREHGVHISHRLRLLQVLGPLQL